MLSNDFVDQIVIILYITIYILFAIIQHYLLFFLFLFLKMVFMSIDKVLLIKLC